MKCSGLLSDGVVARPLSLLWMADWGAQVINFLWFFRFIQKCYFRRAEFGIHGRKHIFWALLRRTRTYWRTSGVFGLALDPGVHEQILLQRHRLGFEVRHLELLLRRLGYLFHEWFGYLFNQLPRCLLLRHHLMASPWALKTSLWWQIWALIIYFSFPLERWRHFHIAWWLRHDQ